MLEAGFAEAIEFIASVDRVHVLYDQCETLNHKNAVPIAVAKADFTSREQEDCCDVTLFIDFGVSANVYVCMC